ncbi:MAG: hypothetical protein ACN4GW_00030 [Desulforhopalus sp.]
MKEYTEILTRNLFTQFPAYHAKNRRRNPLTDVLKRHAPTWREQLTNILATTGIGVILLVSIAFFLIQLAEYSEF